MVAYVLEWGWLRIGSYGVMMALGFLCAWYLLRLELKRKEIAIDLASQITFNAAIWGVIGARLLSLFEEPGRLLDNPVRMLLLEGGLTWYGGLVAGAGATIYTIVKAKAPVLPVLDAMSPAAFVGYAFGRAGCLLSGDGCYGIATDLPWGMQFPHLPDEGGFHCLRAGAIAEWPPVDPGTCADPGNLATCLRYPPDVYVHPTPIYEILASLALFGILWLLRKRFDRPAGLLGLFWLLGSVPRFLVEFIRLNPRYAGLSLSQWIAIGTAVLGIALLRYAFTQPPYQPPSAVADKPARGKKRRR